MKKIIFIFWSLFVYNSFGLDNYSHIYGGMDIAKLDDITFAATKGGLVAVSGGNKRILYEGLDNNLIAVAKDYRNNIWIADYSNAITIIDWERQTRSYLTDFRENTDKYKIKDIIASNKYIYILTKETLFRYTYNSSYNKYILKDSFKKQASFMKYDKKKNMLYLFSKEGIYLRKESNDLISNSSEWHYIKHDLEIVSSFILQNTLYFCDKEYHLNKIINKEIVNVDFGEKIFIEDGVYQNSYYYIISKDSSNVVNIMRGKSMLASEMQTIYSEKDPFITQIIFNQGQCYILSDAGLSTLNLSHNPLLKKNIRFLGPINNNINGFIVDGNRMLYHNQPNENAGIHRSKVGFVSIDGDENKWAATNFYQKSSVKNMIKASNGRYYAGTWGQGVISYSLTGNNFKKLKSYNFGSAVGKSNYPVHPGVEEDSKGNIWSTIYIESNNSLEEQSKYLAKIPKDGSEPTIYKSKIEGGSVQYGTANTLYIDKNDILWVGSSTDGFDNRYGLLLAKEYAGNLQTKIFTVDSNGESLPGIVKVVEDKKNIIWIATKHGLFYIDKNFKEINKPANLTTKDILPFNSLPNNLFIKDIEINSKNEKWLATDKGIIVISGESNSLSHYYNKHQELNLDTYLGKEKHLDIPTIEINALKFNHNESHLYISYAGGCSVFQYSSIIRTNKHQEIRTYPSPFIVDGEKVVEFYLPDNKKAFDRFKVYDLKGRLVFSSPHNMDNWNGYDDEGEPLNSGVYQVVFYNEADKSQQLVGKIAIIKK